MKDAAVSKTSEVKQISLVIIRLEIDDINIDSFNDSDEFIPPSVQSNQIIKEAADSSFHLVSSDCASPTKDIYNYFSYHCKHFLVYIFYKS
jgi:hypothetical protein